MRRRFVQREPIGVTARRNRATMLALIHDPAQRARYEADNPESRMPALPKKRAPRPEGVDIDAIHRKQPSADLEGPVLAAVGELLAAHPSVLLAVRQNSGAMPYQNSAGRMVPVWFYKLIRKPEKVRITDYWGFLINGKPFAFECKKPSWREPHGDRELEQSAFIDLIKRAGGIGAFITDAEQVNAMLAH
jgi:hypothetical protein